MDSSRQTSWNGTNDSLVAGRAQSSLKPTGIRDIPSGPLLRLGDDRFVPGIKQLVDVVRRASGGHTRLLIQLIDFLAMRRRPERAKYFERLLRLRRRIDER